MRFLVALLVAAAAVAPLGCGVNEPPELSNEEALRDTYEWAFSDRLNASRAEAGLKALPVVSGLRDISREWSAHVADLGRLSHRSDMPEQVNARVTTDWTLWGENTGAGNSVDGLHRAFMESADHRANMLGAFDYVGVGVEVRPGRLWTTYSFLQSSARLPTIERPPRLVTPSPSPSACGWMRAGQGLARGDALPSCDERFRLMLQMDGNVVLYEGDAPLWSTRTVGSRGFALNMEASGDLLLLTRYGDEVWSSGTDGRSGAALLVQDDGNVVIYSARGEAVWATRPARSP